MYIDQLTDSSNEIDYMMGSKGITQESIKYVIDNEFSNYTMMPYKYNIDRNTQMFVLTKRKTAFGMKNDISIATCQHFEKRIKTGNKESNHVEYFIYEKVIDDNDEKIEPDESVIDRVIEEDNIERNELITSFKDKTFKTLISD